MLVLSCLEGGTCSWWQTGLDSSFSHHTADRSTRGAEWLLLSQGLSLVEAVPGRVPFMMSELKGLALPLRPELPVRDQTLVLCLKAALTSEFRRQ